LNYIGNSTKILCGAKNFHVVKDVKKAKAKAMKESVYSHDLIRFNIIIQR